MKTVFRTIIKLVLLSIVFMPSSYYFWYKSVGLKEAPILVFILWILFLIPYVFYFNWVANYVDKILD